MQRQESQGFAISDWVVTEFSAALSVKLRADKITVDDRSIALARFARLASRAFDTFSIGSRDFGAAAQLADQSSLGLRAGEALHLAVARRVFATLCTRDRKLAAACATLGVKAELI
jgi:predicted nucleic acid-binding protein